MPSVCVILMGVTGAGKSTVMPRLAARMNAVSAEGDSFHSAANVDKMRAGIPLDDDDRRPWLRSIATWIGAREDEGTDAVVTCSALRRRYRDLLRAGHPSVRFVHLLVAEPTLDRRVSARRGHYMPASLLSSQLETLEPLMADEPGFAIEADRPPAELAEEIARRIEGASRPERRAIKLNGPVESGEPLPVRGLRQWFVYTDANGMDGLTG